MKNFWIISLLLVLASLAQAEEKIHVEEVVVTATRYEEKVSEVPSNVSVISEEEINNSTAQNIPDLLRTEVGVHVNDIIGNRRAYTVDLRGFGETAGLNTLVLVDGRRVNQPDLSGVDWTEIPLERVSRIEIIKGGRGSVLYGDNATGGVINIITKRGEGGLKAGASLAAGSYGTFKADAYAGGSLKDLSLYLSGNYLTSDGYRDNSKTEEKDLGFNTAYYVKDFMKIDFSSGYHKDDTRLPGALKESDFAAGASRTDSLHPDDFADTEEYYLKLTPEVYFYNDSVFKVDTSLRRRDFLSFSSGDWGHFLGDSEIKTIAVSPQVIFKKDFGRIKNILTAGFDYQKADQDILNSAEFFTVPSKEKFNLKKETYGYYAHDEISLTDFLHISGGYRHDKARFSFDPGDSTTMSEDAYTAGINYIFYKSSYAYLSYSRSFRYPVFDELYSFFNNTINESLNPQTSDDYEAGIRHYFSDDFFINVNIFKMDTDKEIFFNPDLYINENLDGVTSRKGVEISFDAKATGWLTLKGGYSFVEAKIKEGEFRGSQFPNVPKHKATMTAVSSIGENMTLALTGVYVGERPFVSDFNNDLSDQKGYFLLNTKFTYKWKSLKAYVDINNLTNKEYSEYGVEGGFPLEKAYYPSPKRNILAGVSLEF
jgi:iron complex outermembrane receptor protein